MSKLSPRFEIESKNHSLIPLNLFGKKKSPADLLKDERPVLQLDTPDDPGASKIKPGIKSKIYYMQFTDKKFVFVRDSERQVIVEEVNTSTELLRKIENQSSLKNTFWVQVLFVECNKGMFKDEEVQDEEAKHEDPDFENVIILTKPKKINHYDKTTTDANSDESEFSSPEIYRYVQDSIMINYVSVIGRYLQTIPILLLASDISRYFLTRSSLNEIKNLAYNGTKVAVNPSEKNRRKLEEQLADTFQKNAGVSSESTNRIVRALKKKAEVSSDDDDDYDDEEIDDEEVKFLSL